MTDYPAVVYLKPQVSCKEVDSENDKDNNGNVKSVKKRIKVYKSSIRSRKRIETHKKLLEAMKNVILKKMDKIDGRLSFLSKNSDRLEKKVDTLASLFDSSSDHYNGIQEKYAGPCTVVKNNLAVPVSPNVTQITLNTKADYPEGSWLGFENNPEMRVRCKISPKDLNQINRNFITPEKMALALLDHLVDRETQACSNISGLGKHKKTQLDPLLIYGIKCHLIYRFDITEDDWTRVKIHIDSKCRTAFRRKQRGMSLSPQKHVPPNPSDCVDSASPHSKHSYSSNANSDKEMSCDDQPQSEENENSGSALQTLMEIILSEK